MTCMNVFFFFCCHVLIFQGVGVSLASINAVTHDTESPVNICVFFFCICTYSKYREHVSFSFIDNCCNPHVPHYLCIGASHVI